MKTEAVKIAEINAKKELTISGLTMARTTLTNPVVEILAGFLAVEALQKRGFFQDKLISLPFPFQNMATLNLGDAIEVLISEAVLLQQLSPILPSLVDVGGNIVGDLFKGLMPAMGLLAK